MLVWTSLPPLSVCLVTETVICFCDDVAEIGIDGCDYFVLERIQNVIFVCLSSHRAEGTGLKAYCLCWTSDGVENVSCAGVRF